MLSLSSDFFTHRCTHFQTFSVVSIKCMKFEPKRNYLVNNFAWWSGFTWTLSVLVQNLIPLHKQNTPK